MTTAVAMEPSTEEEIADLLAGEDKQEALARLSSLFSARGRDIRYLWACAQLLQHFEPYLSYHHDVLWRIIGSTWLAQTCGTEALRDKIFYEAVGPSYLRVVNAVAGTCRFPPHLPTSNERRRLLFVSHALISPNVHSPTLVAFEYIGALARLFDVEIMLLDARHYPKEPSSDFVSGSSWAHGSRAPGLSSLNLAGHPIMIYTTKTQGMTEEKLVDAVNVALRFNPDFVIAHGWFNFIGDLLARRFPTVCMEMTRTEPVSQAHSFILFENMVRHLRMPATGLLPHEPKTYSLNSLLPPPPRVASYARERFGLTADHIVYVIVGYRLHSDITDAFDEVLAHLLDHVPNAVILTVGNQRRYRHPRLLAAADRVRHLGLESDLRALYAICDCFLNPPRQGGGGSALLAVAEHLPILTLPDCDVAGVIGNANAVVDLDELAARAIALGRDANFRAEARAAAKALWENVPKFDDTVRALWDVLIETKMDFDIRASESV